MKLRLFIATFVSGLFSLLLIYSTPVIAAPFKPGDTAPAFKLKNLQGKMVSLSSLTKKGHVMLVFWELECVYCYSHISDFNALQAKYRKKGLTIAGINFLGEYADDVRTYAKDNNVKYMLLAERLNNIDVAESYKVIGSPTIVLISPEGTILSYGYTVPDLSKWIN
jgi:peroxiredoxin